MIKLTKEDQLQKVVASLLKKEIESYCINVISLDGVTQFVQKLGWKVSISNEDYIEYYRPILTRKYELSVAFFFEGIENNDRLIVGLFSDKDNICSAFVETEPLIYKKIAFWFVLPLVFETLSKDSELKISKVVKKGYSYFGFWFIIKKTKKRIGVTYNPGEFKLMVQTSDTQTQLVRNFTELGELIDQIVEDGKDD